MMWPFSFARAARRSRPVAAGAFRWKGGHGTPLLRQEQVAGFAAPRRTVVERAARRKAAKGCARRFNPLRAAAV
jgi:hypothetical protein